MKKQALSLAVVVAGAYPVVSNALSLGDIESNSNLNQPLRAKIQLLSASPQEANQLQVRIAPQSVFNRVGIERPRYLDNLRFTSLVENGKPVILITSDTPITEPFVNFLVEVSWPQGQLLKEYTVMLDPPVLMQPGTALAGNEATVRAEPRTTGVVNRPAPQPAQVNRQVVQPQPRPQPQQPQRQQVAAQPAARPAPVQAVPSRQPAPAARQAAPVAANRTYRVRTGDTLYKIASRMRQPGTNVDQVMMALYRANPNAFINENINGLKSGSVLQAPSTADAQSLSRAQARKQVRQQYSQWKQFRSTLAKQTVPQQAAPSGSGRSSASPAEQAGNADKARRLEVLGSQSRADSGGVSAAGKEAMGRLEKELALARESLVTRQRENQELQSKVQELESILRQKNRLIALRDDQLAQLQSQLSGQPVARGATAPQEGVVAGTMDEAGNGQPSSSTSGNIQRPASQPEPVDAPAADGGQDADIQNYVGNVTNPENRVVRAQESVPTDSGSPEPRLTPAQMAQRQLQEARDAARKAAANTAQGLSNNTDRTRTAADSTPENSTASPFADEQQGGGDILGLLTSPMAAKIGAGALASLLLLYLLSRLLGRRKAAAVRDEPLVDETHAAAFNAPQDDDDHFRELEQQLDRAESRESFDDPFGMSRPADPVEGHKSSRPDPDDAVRANEPHDEDEVLMEANVYIAYGLHQQAESELKKALEKHPERLDYRHKLLENYFAANNREAFDEQAQAFLDTRGASRDSGFWKEIADWGRKISPDNVLYSKSGGSSAAGVAAAGIAAAGAVAAAVANHDSQADGPGTIAAGDGHELVEKPAVDSFAGDDLGLDDFEFDLDELERELGESGDGLSGFEDDLGDDLDRVGDGLEAAGHEMADTLVGDGDYSLDDLGEDLQQELMHGTETVEHLQDDGFDLPAPQSVHTDLFDDEVEPLDFDSLLGDSGQQPVAEDSGIAAAAGAAAAGAVSAMLMGHDGEPEAHQPVQDQEDTLDFDFDQDLPASAQPVVDTIGADSVDGSLGDDLDFDLGLDEPLDDAHEAGIQAVAVASAADAGNEKVTNLNLHLDQHSGLRKILPDDTFYTTPDADNPDDAWLGDIDDALSFLDTPDDELDLHEAHISTKLDLARAYLDMGDVEGARSTLEEVMVEGNDNQRREAETLLHQTG
ncbi:MAG: LysM peptidoglycan-binding domain-containing protein [Thiothrix sp.]|nr:LysM peptidoglycan-binding domain-containing protein [Thiothrix sp.]